VGSRAETGRRAEAIVAERLRAAGYAILGTNVRAGRLELDIVAKTGNLLVVCEVRARTGRFDPAESIDARKQDRIRRATLQYIREQRPGTSGTRFDVAAVVFAPDGTHSVEYYEDAFE
jgi:putative endonuclease